LYFDGEEVAEDVSGWMYCDDGESLVFMTDPDESEYSLQRYSKGEVVEIADNVYDHEVLPNGNVVYIADYNLKKGEGELYLFTGKEPVKVDDDVSGLAQASSIWIEMEGYFL
jgi:hypothetical protein